MVKKGILGFIVLFTLLLIPLAVAQPPFQQVSGSERGLDLRFPPVDVIKANTTVTSHMHVHNSTDGLLLTNSSVTCFLHLYNNVGDHIVEKEMGFDDNNVDFEQVILGGNFSKLGFYSFIVWCNSTLSGGFVSGGFEVTPNGIGLDQEESILYTVTFLGVLLLFLLCLYFNIKIEWRNHRNADGMLVNINDMKYLKLSLLPITYALFVWVLNMLLGMTGFLQLEMASGFFEFMFLLVSGLAWPIFVLWLIIYIVVFTRDRKLLRRLKEGLENYT